MWCAWAKQEPLAGQKANLGLPGLMRLTQILGLTASLLEGWERKEVFSKVFSKSTENMGASTAGAVRLGEAR